jgi:hypothetical protein
MKHERQNLKIDFFHHHSTLLYYIQGVDKIVELRGF